MNTPETAEPRAPAHATVGEGEPSPQELPFAIVRGAPFTKLPRDLYIPPDALEVFLETFEGPLDLLLYLIKRQNLDILDIPIAEVTRQYMEYVALMKELRLELAAEYLVMAAILAEIKSRMLLPQPKVEDEEEDPRAELIRRLQEYERFKLAAKGIDALPQMGKEIFAAGAAPPAIEIKRPHPKVHLAEVLRAFHEALIRARMFSNHQVNVEPLSVRERMANILIILQSDELMGFDALFRPDEGRRGVVVALLALLELIKESMVELVQNAPFEQIRIRRL